MKKICLFSTKEIKDIEGAEAKLYVNFYLVLNKNYIFTFLIDAPDLACSDRNPIKLWKRFLLMLEEENVKCWRRYETLLKPPVSFKVEKPKIDTIKFEHVYPKELVIDENDTYFQEIVVKDIMQCLASNISKYVDYYTEFDPHLNMYHFYGKIKVINTESEENTNGCKKV